jgi:hypothetical protein
LPFFSPSGFGPPCIPNCSTRLSALSRSRESSREFHTLSTGAFATCGSFFLFSFAEYPVASGLRSRSGYFGGVGCCGELHS